MTVHINININEETADGALHQLRILSSALTKADQVTTYAVKTADQIIDVADASAVKLAEPVVDKPKATKSEKKADKKTEQPAAEPEKTDAPKADAGEAAITIDDVKTLLNKFINIGKVGIDTALALMKKYGNCSNVSALNPATYSTFMDAAKGALAVLEKAPEDELEARKVVNDYLESLA